MKSPGSTLAGHVTLYCFSPSELTLSWSVVSCAAGALRFFFHVFFFFVFFDSLSAAPLPLCFFGKLSGRTVASSFQSTL
tara:strand:- start:50 stop:286 length:237 start_codon:yes stop_codon:yes gene_type:complete